MYNQVAVKLCACRVLLSTGHMRATTDISWPAVLQLCQQDHCVAMWHTTVHLCMLHSNVHVAIQTRKDACNRTTVGVAAAERFVTFALQDGQLKATLLQFPV